MRRTIVIGDVHGCHDELKDLLAATGADAQDRLVLVGDLVAKGPDSLGVLALARERRAEAVMGNHDAAVLACGQMRAGEAPTFRYRPEHERLAERLEEADWQYLRAMPLSLMLQEHAALVVHAGLVPGRSLEAQRREDLLTMRTLSETGEGCSRFEGTPWASRWRGPPHVYFGHDALRGLQCHPHATGLDTGCVYGGRLTACILPEARLVSVPARRVYRQPEERSAGG